MVKNEIKKLKEKIKELEEENLKLKNIDYRNEMRSIHKNHIFTLTELKYNFRNHMNDKKKILFDYFIKRLETEKIIYKFTEKGIINIILENVDNFYFEIFDDFSGEYINFENKETDLNLRYKKDIDEIIDNLKEDLKHQNK
jgi:hypothetical protein